MAHMTTEDLIPATLFKFLIDGKTYELPDRFKLAEVVWIQKALGLDLSECGQVTQTMLGMFLTVRRTDPQRWGVKALENLTTEDFEVIDPNVDVEEQEEDVDPTAESGRTLETESTPSSLSLPAS